MKLPKKIKIHQMAEADRINPSAVFYEMNGRMPNSILFQKIDIDKLIQEPIFKNKMMVVERDKDSFKPRDFEDEDEMPPGLTVQLFAILKKNVFVYYNQEDHDNRLDLMFSDKKDIKEILKVIRKNKLVEKNRPKRINLICQDGNDLYLKDFKIKKLEVDIDVNYNDDFKPVDDVIKNAINQDGTSGLILLHGIPGSGKTHYIRNIISVAKKRVIYAPPDFAEAMSSPGLMGFLIRYPDSVLVIEDAENVIQERTGGGSGAISNILNLCDGLLSDCLNMIVLCTFNTEVTKIDKALMRKGRLIARYDFKPLEKSKAQKLSNSLGYNTVIEKETTLSEIYNRNNNFGKIEDEKTLGFKTNAN